MRERICFRGVEGLKLGFERRNGGFKRGQSIQSLLKFGDGLAASLARFVERLQRLAVWR